MKAIVIIPARYASTRLPGKPLLKKTGKFLIQHVYERSCLARLPEKVIIATDDTRIFKASKSFKADVVMTSSTHRTGSDRIAEVARDIDADIVVNVQGDLPEIAPGHIDAIIQGLFDKPSFVMAAPRTKFKDIKQIVNSNVIKTVVDCNNRAIYFSRGVIPFSRKSGGLGKSLFYWKHIGIYAYRKDFLLKFVSLPQKVLEQIEMLEQLRAIEYGYPILSVEVDGYCEGIDSPEQYAEFVERYE